METEKEMTAIQKTQVYLENYREIERYIKDAISETGFATMDGENKFKDVSLMEFPYLTTGQEKEHHLIFSDNNALVTLQYKPMWL